MKIICSSWEKEKLIKLISESSKSCKNDFSLYDKCKYDCEETLEKEIDWELENEDENFTLSTKIPNNMKVIQRGYTLDISKPNRPDVKEFLQKQLESDSDK